MTDTINEGPLNVNNQSCEPYGKFRIAKDALTEIAYACQDREFSQEVDKLQEQGGDQWIQVHPLAATRLGRTLHRLQQGHPRRPRRPQAARHRLREQQEAGDQAQKLLPTSYSHSRGFHPQDPHRLRHHQHHHRNRHCRPKPPLTRLDRRYPSPTPSSQDSPSSSLSSSSPMSLPPTTTRRKGSSRNSTRSLMTAKE